VATGHSNGHEMAGGHQAGHGQDGRWNGHGASGRGAVAGRRDAAGQQDGDSADSVQDWAGELRADLVDDHLTPATLSMLGLVLGPLRISVDEAHLDPAHGLRRAMRSAESLRADFARSG
jgi:hypothetical protein